MGSDIPKQYLMLGRRCVLQVSLNKLLSFPAIEKVIVALSPDDIWFEQFIAADRRIQTLVGGAERAHSVMRGLEYLVTQGHSDDWVLVHDAARPCVDPAQLNVLYESALASATGAILACAVADTIKQSRGLQVQHTVDRSALWLAHTPQIFPVGELHNAMAKALANNLVVTDESSAMELNGCRPVIVPDSRDNLKITQSEDLALAEWILQKQGFLA